MNQAINLSATVALEQCDQRLDQTIAELFTDYSRSRLKEWIMAGYVKVDGDVVTKARIKVLGEEIIEVNAFIELEERHKAEDIPLNIVFEDEHILVINKPAGLVVHPGAGNGSGTVLNALLHHHHTRT